MIKMIKIKHIFTIVILSVLVFACAGSGSDDEDDFDASEQALIDQDTLTNFFSNYYFDADIDSIKPLVEGKIALIDDPALQFETVTENEISYNLYYYTMYVGDGTPYTDANGNLQRKSFPTVMDSIYTQYSGYSIEKTDSIASFETSYNPNWFTLNGVIRGWTYGMTKFKGGENVTDNGPIRYENEGRGILFMPSGLAYGNTGSLSIASNRCLLFYVNLYDVIEDTDHDNDGVPSIDEDPDGNGDPRDDDTDEDGFVNYFDTNDDNDGVLTIDEDVNGDGDPRNDDTDQDGIPNYLDTDDDGDGILSINEDTNADGDYTNDDADGDGTPDYLDPDN